MPAQFKIQLRNFRLLEKRSTKGKILRFDLVWRLDIENPNPEIATLTWRPGATMHGCLAYVSSVTGELFWHPPQSKKGNRYIQYLTVSPDLYTDIKRMITDSVYFQEIALPKHMVWNSNFELAGYEKPYQSVPFENEDLNES